MTYTVTVNFGGFIGADEEYIIEADSREEAEELALEEARDDISVVSVDCDDDEEEEEEEE